MENIKIFTDSSSDLSKDYYDRHEVVVVPFSVTFDKKTYYAEGVDIMNEQFYKKLRNENVYPSTSTPNTAQYREAFQKALVGGMDVICLCLTSKFSFSYQSAMLAREELVPEYPDRKIAIIDSAQASCGQGLVLNEIVKMRDRGFKFNEIVGKIDERKENARVFLTVDSLDYLTKGGRVGKTAALAGSILNIKPIIAMLDGELNPVCKIRGRQKSIHKVLDLTAEYIGGEKDKYDLVVLHADCAEEAENIHKQLQNGGYSLPLGIQTTGITIGAHTGPTLVGIALIKRIV